MVVHADCSKRSTDVKNESLKIQHELAKSAAILLAFAVGDGRGGPLGAILAIIALPVFLCVLILLRLGMLLTPKRLYRLAKQTRLFCTRNFRRLIPRSGNTHTDSNLLL